MEGGRVRPGLVVQAQGLADPGAMAAPLGAGEKRSTIFFRAIVILAPVARRGQTGRPAHKADSPHQVRSVVLAEMPSIMQVPLEQAVHRVS